MAQAWIFPQGKGYEIQAENKSCNHAAGVCTGHVEVINSLKSERKDSHEVEIVNSASGSGLYAGYRPRDGIV
jgi:hypothetical protein